MINNLMVAVGYKKLVNNWLDTGDKQYLLLNVLK